MVQKIVQGFVRRKTKAEVFMKPGGGYSRQVQSQKGRNVYWLFSLAEVHVGIGQT
jgi:hypothetical protein